MRVRHSVELEAPLAFAYELFHRVDELPRFLPAVRRVEADDASERRFRVEVTSTSRCVPLRVELLEATPERRIAWRHLDGSIASGAIEFEPLSPWVTRLHVELELRDAAVPVEPHYRQLAAQWIALQRYLATLARLRRVARSSRSITRDERSVRL